MQIVALLLQQLSNGTNCHYILKPLQILRNLKKHIKTHLYTQAFCNNLLPSV